MVRQPVDNPLPHLDLAAILAMWPSLSVEQQEACAAYRGVGVGDVEVLWEVTATAAAAVEIASSCRA